MIIQIPFLPFESIPADQEALKRFDQAGSKLYSKFARPIMFWEAIEMAHVEPNKPECNIMLIVTICEGVRLRCPSYIQAGCPRTATTVLVDYTDKLAAFEKNFWEVTVKTKHPNAGVSK
jgi:hypothetical protein